MTTTPPEHANDHGNLRLVQRRALAGGRGISWSPHHRRGFIMLRRSHEHSAPRHPLSDRAADRADARQAGRRAARRRGRCSSSRSGTASAPSSFAAAPTSSSRAATCEPLDRYFPELHDALLRAALPERCVVDGEIVIATRAGARFRRAPAAAASGGVAGGEAGAGDAGVVRRVRPARRRAADDLRERAAERAPRAARAAAGRRAGRRST